MSSSTFSQQIIEVIKRIPKGKVATYGQIAGLAGNHRAARQVVRVLHSSSKKEGLPWHRVINGKGKISLKPGRGFELQKSLLEAEGVTPNQEGIIDLSIYLWRPKE